MYLIYKQIGTFKLFNTCSSYLRAKLSVNNSGGCIKITDEDEFDLLANVQDPDPENFGTEDPETNPHNTVDPNLGFEKHLFRGRPKEPFSKEFSLSYVGCCFQP